MFRLWSGLWSGLLLSAIVLHPVETVAADVPNLARLSFWVAPERMADFEQVYAEQIAPLLDQHGLVPSKLSSRATVDSAFSRLFEFEGSVAIRAAQKALAGLIDTFVSLGGNMLTVTVTDAEELKLALLEPEKYRHLRVRVRVRMGGWSAYFVMLGEEQQRLHIRRVEHGLV